MKLLQSLYTIIEEKDDSFSIKLNAKHIIYQAHFPEKPITPGVCILQIIQELAEIKCHQKLQLEQVNNLKFVNPISPGDHQKLDVILNISENLNVKGYIKSDKIFTKFSILFKI